MLRIENTTLIVIIMRPIRILVGISVSAISDKWPKILSNKDLFVSALTNIHLIGLCTSLQMKFEVRQFMIHHLKVFFSFILFIFRFIIRILIGKERISFLNIAFIRFPPKTVYISIRTLKIYLECG